MPGMFRLLSFITVSAYSSHASASSTQKERFNLSFEKSKQERKAFHKIKIGIQKETASESLLPKIGTGKDFAIHRIGIDEKKGSVRSALRHTSSQNIAMS